MSNQEAQFYVGNVACYPVLHNQCFALPLDHCSWIHCSFHTWDSPRMHLGDFFWSYCCECTSFLIDRGSSVMYSDISILTICAYTPPISSPGNDRARTRHSYPISHIYIGYYSIRCRCNTGSCTSDQWNVSGICSSISSIHITDVGFIQMYCDF